MGFCSRCGCLYKVNDPGFCFFVVALLQALSRPPAIASSTWSWRHLYRPSASDLVHELSICSRVALFPHRMHAGLSVSFQMARLLGDGNVSYTDDMANLSFRGSVLHSSFHVSFLLRAFSHRSQLPCALRLTALVFRFSSSCCRTSDWTSSLRKSSEAFFHLARVMHPSPSLP